MKRLLAMLLALSMVVSMLPAAALAEGTGEEGFQTEQAVGAVEEPEEEPVEPSEGETTEPTEETMDPTEETTEPTEETTAPTGETTEPTEETTAPTGETAEPTEETTDPTEESSAPDGEVSGEVALEEDLITGSTGELRWFFDRATGTLTISGEGIMEDYGNTVSSQTKAPWANFTVRTVILQEGVTTVGKNAFSGMKSITGNLVFPESLTEIKEGAFSGTLLTGELRLGSGLTKLGYRAFGDTLITKVTLPGGLTLEGYDPMAFSYCKVLTEILAPEDSKYFKTIDGVLYSADGKTLLSGPAGKTGTLDIPDTVETISEGAFIGSSITAVTLPRSVKTVEAGAFSGSRVATVFYAGTRLERKALTLGTAAFENSVQWTDRTCGEELLWDYDEAAKTLTISGRGAMDDYTYDGGGNHAPWAGLGAVTLSLGEGVTTVGSHAFFGMSSLTGSLVLPGTMETVGDAAFGKTGFTSVTLNAGLKKLENGAFHACEALVQVNAFPDSLEVIEDNAFSYSGLTGEVCFGSKLQKLGARSFANTGITKVTLPAQLTAEGYSIDAFAECGSLTAIAAAEGNTHFASVDGVLYTADRKTLLSGPAGKRGTLAVPEGVETIRENAFFDGRITAVSLPMSIKTVEYGAFMGRVRDVTYPGSWADMANIELNGNLDPDQVRWHYGAQGIISETLSYTYDESTGTLTVSGQGAIPGFDAEDENAQRLPWFKAKIKHLVIAEGITGIGDGAFASMPLISAEFPASLTVCNFGEVFADSYELKEVSAAAGSESFVSIDGLIYTKNEETLLLCPAGRTEPVRISAKTTTVAAKACRFSKVGELILPASVTAIEKDAFSGAWVSRVTYLGTQEQKQELFYNNIEVGNDPLFTAFWKTEESADSIGDRVSWSYDAETKTLNIFGEGRMDDYSEDFPAPWQNMTVTKLVVGDGVSKLGAYGFAGLALKSVSLPSSLISVGANAFAGTPKGIAVTFAGSIEGWTYGISMENCGLDNPKVTCKGKNRSGELTWTFKNDTLTFSGKGKMVDYQYFEDSKDGWERPEWLRWNLPVRKITFSADVTYIGQYAFRSMADLQQVTLPQKLETIGMEAFAYSGLTGKLTVPGSVKLIETEAFRGTAITSLELPAGVGLDMDAFADCAQLTDITYGGSEDVLRDMLGESVSEEVKLHGQNPNGGIVTDGLYWSLDKQGTLTFTVTISRKIPDYDSYDSTPWAGKTIKKLVLPDDIISIGANAFSGCKTLTGELTLPGNLRYLGENAFAGTGIKTLRVNVDSPNTRLSYAENAFEGSKLTDVYYSFAENYLRELLGEGHPLLKCKLHCSYVSGGWEQLGEYEFLKWAVSSKGVLSFPYGWRIPDYEPLEAPWSRYKVTAVNLSGIRCVGKNAFYGMTGLTKLTLPNTLWQIGKQAFYGCTNLTGTLIIPEGAEEIGDRAFSNLPKITVLELPESLRELGVCVFTDCTGLKRITYAGSKARLRELDSNLLDCGAQVICRSSGGSNLECGAEWTLDTKGTLTIEGQGTLNVTWAEDWMFRDLNVRKVIILPGITEIGEYSFENMDITEVSLPDGLEKLGEGAFLGCENLTKITLPASLRELGNQSLDNECLKTVAVAKGSQFLTVKGGVLYSADMKKLLLVPAGVKKLTLPDSVTTVVRYALTNEALTSLTLGAGFEPMDNYTPLSDVTQLSSISVSKKNPNFRVEDNVLFAGNTLVLYPENRAGAEYRVPEGITEIAGGAVYFPNRLTRLILPETVTESRPFGIRSRTMELVVLGKDTRLWGSNYCGHGLCLEGSQASNDFKSYGVNYDYLNPEETVRVTFQAPEKTTGIPEDLSGSYDTKVTIPKKAPALKGYAFLGWQDEKTESVYQPGTTLTLTQDMTLTARFRKNGVVQEGRVGDTAWWALEKNGTLTIFGTGAADGKLHAETDGGFTAKRLVIEEGITELGHILYPDYISLKGEVVIPASMERIEEFAFVEQKGITKLTFASSIDAKGLTVEDYAFGNCTGLKGTVTLPVQLGEIAPSAFDGCSGITALNTAASFTFTGYESRDGVLYKDAGQKLVRCPEGKTGAMMLPMSNIQIMDGAFWNSRVTTIYYQGEGWKNIPGREQLPVYPTFAYEIAYGCNLPEEASLSTLTFAHANPRYILPTQAVTLKNATVDGYIFRGWYNQEGQKVTKIAKGTQETVLLIAHFDPITYTVAYNGGGGKGSMGKVTVTYDQEQTVAENGFTRPGYTFTGWNTAKNGKGTAYKPGDTLRNLTTKQKGTVTLYAQWEQSK